MNNATYKKIILANKSKRKLRDSLLIQMSIIWV